MCGDLQNARLAGLFFIAALVGHACAPARQTTTLHELAEQYVRVTLQIAQHRPTLVDSWTGPAEWQPGPRVPVAQLRQTVNDLLARLDAIRPASVDPTERPRLAYLRGQLRALLRITGRLLGETAGFAEEVEQMLGTPLGRPDANAVSATHASLERELPGRGSLAARYAAFRRQYAVRPERVEAVVKSAIDACRAATAPHLTLPADERLELSSNDSLEWDAYAKYRGAHATDLQIRPGAGRDVATLLRMACHETYAGHHAQHILIDDALVTGRRWLEFHLAPAFGPHTLITEGAAEAAVDLALPDSEKATIYRERLLPLAGLPPDGADRLARVDTLAGALDTVVPGIVAAYLDGEATRGETAARLASDALLLSPDQFVAFAERHRVNAVVYPLGKAVVSEWVGRATGIDQRWRRLQDLFTRTPFALN